jgi:hypothetical protein
MLIKITLAFALAIAALSTVPASVGSSFAQSNPTLDCLGDQPVLVSREQRSD